MFSKTKQLEIKQNNVKNVDQAQVQIQMKT
jgi:hypothetical protein